MNKKDDIRKEIAKEILLPLIKNYEQRVACSNKDKQSYWYNSAILQDLRDIAKRYEVIV